MNQTFPVSLTPKTQPKQTMNKKTTDAKATQTTDTGCLAVSRNRIMEFRAVLNTLNQDHRNRQTSNSAEMKLLKATIEKVEAQFCETPSTAIAEELQRLRTSLRNRVRQDEIDYEIHHLLAALYYAFPSEDEWSWA